MWKYSKAILSGVITILYAIQSALSDGVITNTEWIAVLVLAINTFGVYVAKNQTVPTDL